MKIRLHIERVVVDGAALGPGGGKRLQGAIETELARLLGQGAELNPALSPGGMTPRLAMDSIALPSGADAAQLGRAIAGTLYGGLTEARKE